MANRDVSQLLPMAVVLGGASLDPSPEILYASYIDKGKIEASFNSLVDLGAEGGICQSKIKILYFFNCYMEKLNL